MTVTVSGCRLRVEVEIESSGDWLCADYDNMTVESQNNNYTLHVTGYHGNAGDAFNDDHVASYRANGMPFSTPDVDNDKRPGGSCAYIRSCGWWFRRCSRSNLNCITSGYWYVTPTGSARPFSASRMMLQCGAVQN